MSSELTDRADKKGPMLQSTIDPSADWYMALGRAALRRLECQAEPFSCCSGFAVLRRTSLHQGLSRTLGNSVG